MGQWSAARTGKPWPPQSPGSLQADTAWPRGPVNRGRFARKQEDVVCQGRGPGFCKPPGPPVALWVQPDAAPPRARPPGMPRTGEQLRRVRSGAWAAELAPVLPGLPCDCTQATLTPSCVDQAEDCPARAAVRPGEWRSPWRWMWRGGHAAGRAQKWAALGVSTGSAVCHKSGAVQCAEQRARQLAGRAGTWPSSDFLRLEDQVTPPGEKCDG